MKTKRPSGRAGGSIHPVSVILPTMFITVACMLGLLAVFEPYVRNADEIEPSAARGVSLKGADPAKEMTDEDLARLSERLDRLLSILSERNSLMSLLFSKRERIRALIRSGCGRSRIARTVNRALKDTGLPPADPQFLNFYLGLLAGSEPMEEVDDD